jgi:hypothetical protein
LFERLQRHPILTIASAMKLLDTSALARLEIFLREIALRASWLGP